MKEEKKVAVVAGGGIVGIFGAILLADVFETVYIIEKESTCGGLLRSVKNDIDISYDYGSHLAKETLVPEIDQILFDRGGGLRDWSCIEGGPRQGSYFAGNWNYENAQTDARNIEKRLYNKGVQELLSRKRQSSKMDVKSYLYDTIGPTFSDNITLPIIKKIYNTDPQELTLEATHWPGPGSFGLKNIIAFPAVITHILKNDKTFDNELVCPPGGDVSCTESRSYYPDNSIGIQSWIEYLLNKADRRGIKIINDDYIANICHESKQVKAIRLGKCDKSISCDFILWTCPVSSILKSANMTSNNETPTRYVSSHLFHLAYDSPLTNQNNTHLWNWDCNYAGLRLTLYPNMQRTIQPPLNNITVEVMSSEVNLNSMSIDRIDEELRETGLVPSSAVVINATKQIIHNTFPVPSFEYQRKRKEEIGNVTEAFKNMCIAGQSVCKTWFLNDIIRDTYFKIREIF